MIPVRVKLLFVFACLASVSISTEAANTCRVTTTTCIPGPPGRDGKDGQPGRDGVPAPAGALTYADGQQLKEEILETIRREMSILQCCNSTQPTTDAETRCNGTSESEPGNSCNAIYECDPTFPSGHYWIRNSTGGAVQVYCDMEIENCGNITGWRRVVKINMTNGNDTCPQELTYTVVNSTRMCTRVPTVYDRCTSVTFPTHTVPYAKVCGRARGYQFSATSAFYGYHVRGQTSLDEAYVEGLSVTHGSPRKHIWTFAAERSKDHDYFNGNCPCNPLPLSQASPLIVGEEYFCESGNTGQFENQWYLDDPLWDSQGCASGSPCCDRGGPWFTNEVGHSVSDDIEVRMCFSFPFYDIGVDQLEIYTQ